MYKVLLLGYYGMDNLGSDVRLKIIIDDLLSISKNIQIRVATIGLFEEKKYPNVEFINLNGTSLFNPIKLLPHIKWSDIVINGEGIPFLDFVGIGFLAYFLPALFLSQFFNKKTICHSFDIDEMGRLNTILTKRVLEKTDLLIVRTPDSKHKLTELQINKKIHVTADPAIMYKEKKIPKKMRRKKKIRFGIILKDFYCYPIVPKLIGNREDIMSYPYYYSYKNKGKKKLGLFKKRFEKYLDNLRYNYECEILLITIDHLMDYSVNKKILTEIKDKSNISLVTYFDYSINEMLGIISTCDYLISARLHGLIFALNFNIPMIGLESDERFKYFFDYIDLPGLCIDYRSERNVGLIEKKTEFLIQNTKEIKNNLKKKYKKLLKVSSNNKKILNEFFNNII